MTIEKLVEKEYAGNMNHPVCEISGCMETDLHDTILTKDGGIYLLCGSCFKKYMRMMSDKCAGEFRKMQSIAISLPEKVKLAREIAASLNL